MNIPSLSRRRTQPATDSNGDGRIDGRDAEPMVTDRDTDATTYRSNAMAADDPGRGPSGRVAAIDDEPRTRVRPIGVTDDDTVRTVPAEERTVDLARGERRPLDHTDADDLPAGPPVVAGPKPRASLLATLGLIVSVAGALFVLTGTLAGYGIGLGAIGAVLSVMGLMATRRRHVAGKTDALIGMLVGLAAVVLGIVAFTGQFDWPTTDGDWVGRLREWLDSQFVDRF
ncbi:thrombospondin [Micromonospora sp. CPCC 205711]|uniref:thrombospondin n=1 Tax=Micromonospora sp. CPCC 205547 TaxID=3122400 RepID=UPI002FEFD61E